ncbi:hypothetical protein B0H14DRAFT_2352745, partial [Mycena olivaceomarginata]
PLVHNKESDVMASYDDAQSFAAKGNFIREQGLKGFSVWHVNGDFNHILLNSIRSERVTDC